MGNSTTQKTKNSIFGEILFRLKENLILIVLIVILAIGAGAIYYKLQKPVYTGSEMLNYMAYYENAKDNDNASSSMNLMSVYIDTMVDFCTTGVVLDRAEYYYTEYLKSDMDIEDFITQVKNGTYNQAYNPSNITKRVYFNSSSVSSSLLNHGNDLIESYILVITASGESEEMAKELTRFFAVAIDQECRDFFQGVKTYTYELVKNTEGVSVTSGKSLIKTLAIFTLLGVVLALAIVYLKVLLDNTVKDKEEIEMLTGVSMLAYIEKQENYSGGKK